MYISTDKLNAIYRTPAGDLAALLEAHTGKSAARSADSKTLRAMVVDAILDGDIDAGAIKG